MKSKPTSTEAWDDAWNLTQPVHTLGWTDPTTKEVDELREVMGRLQGMNLPVRAIYDIANAVLLAWEIGKDTTAP